MNLFKHKFIKSNKKYLYIIMIKIVNIFYFYLNDQIHLSQGIFL